jgi:uncharacterized membrane-anchored protein
MLFRRVIVLVFLLTSLAGGNVWAAGDYNWIEGGKKVELGTIASLDLSPDFVFLNGADTQQMAKDNNNNPSGEEIGSVFPADPNQDWLVIFEYTDSGHIKDDEKTSIDADAILKSYKKGTEESNKGRPAEEHLFVTGWDIPPFYDEASHNLTWSMKGEDSEKVPLLNYNVRLLTRSGYISVILVTDPAHIVADRKVLTEQILSKLTTNNGQRYEDFNAATDKASEHGLSALILGGAGLAVAKKVGLFATIALLAKKFWIVIIVALGGAWRLIKGAFQRKKEEVGPSDSQW